MSVLPAIPRATPHKFSGLCRPSDFRTTALKVLFSQRLMKDSKLFRCHEILEQVEVAD